MSKVIAKAPPEITGMDILLLGHIMQMAVKLSERGVWKMIEMSTTIAEGGIPHGVPELDEAAKRELERYLEHAGVFH